MTTPNSQATVAPRFVHDSSRATLIELAIQKYLDAGREIPLEWIGEYLAILNLHDLEPRFSVIVRPKYHPISVTTSNNETSQP